MKRGLKIALISRHDYCGSGYRLAEAINLHTNNFVHYIRLYSDGQTFYRHPPLYHFQNKQHQIDKPSLNEINKIIKSADILHFKGDYPPTSDFFPNINIPSKPTIITVAGTFFRRHHDHRISRPVAQIKTYLKTTDLRTTFLADLNYPEFKATFTPHPYDVQRIVPISPSQLPEKVTIAHAPSDRTKKGTPKLLQALKKLKTDVNLDIIENKPHRQALARIAQADFLFDQCRMPSYGNVTIEALSRGIPVITYLSDRSIEQGKPLLDNCPIINSGNTPDSIAAAISSAIHIHDYKKLSIQSRHFALRVHSYRAAAQTWSKLYQNLKSKPKTKPIYANS